MGKTAEHILKGKDVELEGRFHLDIEQATPNSPKQKNTALAAPQVSIVENHPNFAVIEVICNCSTKIHVRCEYTDVQSNDQNSEQTE